jgi:hypothetical protein
MLTGGGGGIDGDGILTLLRNSSGLLKGRADEKVIHSDFDACICMFYTRKI